MPRNYRITTVKSAAKSFDLTTLASVKSDLGVSGNAKDAQFRRLITKCSGAISQYCNRTFAQQSYEDAIRPQRDPRPYFLPNGRAPMYVANTPLVSVSSITENAILLVEGTDYEVDYENGYLWRLDDFGYPKLWPAYKIVVDYVAGWVLPGNTGTPALPADVEDACIRMVNARRYADGRDPLLKADEVSGLGRQEFWVSGGNDGNMAPDVTDILDNYRIQAIA